MILGHIQILNWNGASLLIQYLILHTHVAVEVEDRVTLAWVSEPSHGDSGQIMIVECIRRVRDFMLQVMNLLQIFARIRSLSVLHMKELTPVREKRVVVIVVFIIPTVK